LRKHFTSIMETIEAYHPSITRKLSRRLDLWYDTLPEEIKFSQDMRPICDQPRAALRLQYFFTRSMLYWPCVVRLCAQEYDTAELGTLVKSSLSYLTHGAKYIKVMSLALEKKHILLFSDLARTYLMTMMMLHIHTAPGFETLIKNGPRQFDLRLLVASAIEKGCAVLMKWSANENVASKLRIVDSFMRSTDLRPPLRTK